MDVDFDLQILAGRNRSVLIRGKNKDILFDL